MKTAKGGVGKKGVAPVKKGTAKKKVTKKPIGNAMTKKADGTPKKAPGTPVPGAAKKKPVGVKRQSARMKTTQNSNSEKKDETNDEVVLCETTDEVVVVETTSEKTACKITDEVVVCETPDLTTAEAKNVLGKTPVKDAAKETTLGKGHTGTASSDPKEPSGSPSQAATKVNATKIQDKNATSSGSKGTSDVLSKIENFGPKKEEKKPLITGEKKVSGNLGALMASFFSRQREMEKASVSGSEEKVPVTPKKENIPNNQGDEAMRDPDQQEKSDGGKTTKNEKPAGKSDDNSMENQEKDRAKPAGEGTLLSKSSKFSDVTSFEKGKNSDAEKDFKSSEKKEFSPEKSNVKRPATRKGMNSPKTSVKGEEDNQEEKECRKVTSSIGALLAGLGNRQEQMPENKSSPLLKGKGKNLKVDKFPTDERSDKSEVDKSADENKSDELKVEEPEKEKAKFPKSRGTPRVENKDVEKDQVESKKIQSLGSLLAGLGSRKEEFMSPDRQTPSGKSETPKVDKFPEDENKSDKSKVDKFPSDENKSEGFKVNEPEKEKAKFPKSRGTPRVENKDLEKDQVESKKIQSLGSLLAGLGCRKEEFKSPDRQTSSGKSEMSEVKPFPGEENKSFKSSKLNEPKVEKNEAPKTTVENKKIQSIGSLLAGLGSRKEEFTSPDTQTTSGKGNVPKMNQFPTNESRWGGPKMDEPENERGRGPNSRGVPKVESRSFVENKKIHGLGSLLAGLGSRKEEFMNSGRQSMSSDGQSSSDSRGGGRMSESNRRFGDFGFVSDKIQRNKKRSWDSSEDNNENQFSEKSKRTVEPAVREENDVIFVRGHVPKPKPTEKELANRNKSLEKNMTFEQEAERRKTHCLGNLLSSLANRPAGNQSNQDHPPSRGYSDHPQSRGYSDHPQSRGYSDHPQSRGYSDHPQSRGYSDHPQSRGYSDHPQSRGYSDNPPSRGYSDRSSSRGRGHSDHQQSRGYSDHPQSRGHSDHPQSRGYSDRSSSRGRGYSDQPPSRGYSDRPSSRSYPDNLSSSRDNNNSFGQGRQWNRDRGETDFRKRRRDDYDDDDDGRDKRWREKDDSAKGTKDKKEKEPFDPKKAAEVVKSEEERLEKEYGPGVFSVGFTENRILAFVCEICNVQLTKATLEIHADGMQHLKKKNLWEKKKRIQKASSEEKVTYAGGRSGWVKVEESENSASTTPTPAPNSSVGDGSFGFDGSYGQGGYGYNSQFYKQPPPYGSGRMDMRSGDRFGGQYGGPPVAPVNNPALAIPGHINTAIPPPPPPSAEAPPKAKNAKGGATVSLLQRLDACAVKNEKDLDLAASVISALLKSLKEFNHKRGDTKVIEVLTEIDIKFRSLKSKSAISTIEKPVSDVTASTASGGKPTSSQPGYPYSDSSSAPNYDNLSKDNSSGTWYSQGRGNSSGKSTAAFEAIGSSYSNKSSGSYTTGVVSSQGMSSKYSSQPPPANIPSVSSTGYSQQTAKYTQGTDAASASYYSSGYSAQTDNSMKQMDSKKYLPEKSKDTVGGYYTQPPAVSQPVYQGYPDKTGTANVMEIIRSGNEPPPPPPPESNSAHNYGAQGYHSSYPPMGYYNLSAPPPNYNPPQY